jgi:N-methylhydantoinase A
MESHARGLLLSAGGHGQEVVMTRSADMRYLGQGFEIEVPLPDEALGPGHEDVIAKTFVDTYQEIFGRTVGDIPAEVINWRLSARLPERRVKLGYHQATAAARRGERVVHYPGVGDLVAAVYDRYALAPGTRIAGPAVFEERESSFNVGPDCIVAVDDNFNLIADIST